MAEDCKNQEKAFGPSTYGTVLGIQFDSVAMEWAISKEKELSLQETIDFFLHSKTCTLKQVQKLQGKLANFVAVAEKGPLNISKKTNQSETISNA